MLSQLVCPSKPTISLRPQHNRKSETRKWNLYFVKSSHRYLVEPENHDATI